VDTFVTKLNPTGSALVYSTYLGGSTNNYGQAIAVDSAGNAYATGYTDSSDFPTTPGAFQTIFRSAFSFNAFVTKLNPSGTGLVYSTYLGGHGGFASQRGEKRGGDQAHGITVDADGNAYIAGSTDSRDFPTTPHAFQPTNPAATNNSFPPISNAFVTKLNPTGSALVYSTYLGGFFGAGALGIALGPGGSAYIAGGDAGTDFPTTPGAFQTVFPGGGRAAFVTKLNPVGSALMYSTFLGGSTGQDGSFASAIAVDKAQDAYVTGVTSSTDFPTTPGAFQSVSSGGFDAFVTKLNDDGSGLVYSTYVGGNFDDNGSSIAVDSAGDAFVTGTTGSRDFPTTADAMQPALGGSFAFNAFVLALNPQGTALVYSSYLGGNNFDLGMGIALDPSFNAYVTGIADSSNFPTTPGAFKTTGGGNAFVTKIANITGDPNIQ
jgi:hypothetical protein